MSKYKKFGSWVNYRDGEITIDTYCCPDALLTTIDDIVRAAEEESVELLVASLSTDNDYNRIIDIMHSDDVGQMDYLLLMESLDDSDDF